MTSIRKSSSQGFSSVEHLSHEAVAAFVDDEMPSRGKTRAESHLVQCCSCRQEVHEQLAAKAALNKTISSTSESMAAPQDLLSRLTQIPTTCSKNPGGMEQLCGSSMDIDGRRTPETLWDKVGVLLRKFKIKAGR